MKAFLNVVENCISLLNPSEQKKLYVLTIAVSLMSLFELVGVASILPFMSVAVNPESIETNKYLSFVYQFLNFESKQRFLIFLGIGSLCALVFGNVLRALSNYMLLKFAYMQSHFMEVSVFENYLSQSYEFYLSQNSSDLTNTVTSEVNQVVNGVFVPLLRAFGRFTTALFIIAMLVMLDPKVAFIMATLLGLAYLGVYRVLKKKITQLGKERESAGRARFKYLNEASGGIKEVKLMGKENIFLKLFSTPSERFAYGLAHNAIVGELPKYILEVIAFGGIITLVMYLIATKGTGQAITLSSLYAFAGYKLMPALQEIFNSLTKIKFYYPIVQTLTKKLKSEKSNFKTEDSQFLKFKDLIEIKNLSFKFSASTKLILENVSLSISANTTVGIIGPTGSGKTTLVDLILGLLTPSQGEIKIDGVALKKNNLRSWQDQIGYVPQFIYLTDDTIEANIAFAVPKDQVDREKVRRACELAQISRFIEDELPQKYQTIVGERGMRLSGGQRQRLGVARALYHNPSLIVFDEATSALDNETEKALMESIENLSGKKTIIMIAHRLSTIEKADQVIKIEKGQVCKR